MITTTTTTTTSGDKGAIAPTPLLATAETGGSGVAWSILCWLDNFRARRIMTNTILDTLVLTFNIGILGVDAVWQIGEWGFVGWIMFFTNHSIAIHLLFYSACLIAHLADIIASFSAVPHGDLPLHSRAVCIDPSRADVVHGFVVRTWLQYVFSILPAIFGVGVGIMLGYSFLLLTTPARDGRLFVSMLQLTSGGDHAVAFRRFVEHAIPAFLDGITYVWFSPVINPVLVCVASRGTLLQLSFILLPFPLLFLVGGVVAIGTGLASAAYQLDAGELIPSAIVMPLGMAAGTSLPYIAAVRDASSRLLLLVESRHTE